MEGKKQKPKLMGPSTNEDRILPLRNRKYSFAEEGFGGFVEGGDMETDDFKNLKKPKKDSTDGSSDIKED